MISFYGAGTGGQSAKLSASYVLFLRALCRAGRAAVGFLVALVWLALRLLWIGPQILCAALRQGFRRPSAGAVAHELERVRAARNPTPQGWSVCSLIMGGLLVLGLPKEQLDRLEILFWETRDADGNPLPTSTPKHPFS